jgi:hypothetical protein
MRKEIKKKKVESKKKLYDESLFPFLEGNNYLLN